MSTQLDPPQNVFLFKSLYLPVALETKMMTSCRLKFRSKTKSKILNIESAE